MFNAILVVSSSVFKLNLMNFIVTHSIAEIVNFSERINRVSVAHLLATLSQLFLFEK